MEDGVVELLCPKSNKNHTHKNTHTQTSTRFVKLPMSSGDGDSNIKRKIYKLQVSHSLSSFLIYSHLLTLFYSLYMRSNYRNPNIKLKPITNDLHLSENFSQP